MLLMLLIGWTVLLPALVVAGLYLGSSVLGRRRVALGAYEDLFDDEPGIDDPAFAHVPVTVSERPLPGASRHAVAPDPGVRPVETPARRPVGAGH